MPYYEQMKTFLLQASSIAGSQAALARLLGVTPPVVSEWIKKSRPIPADKCVSIEKITNGLVSRRDLRPDDWQRIWPELGEGQPS